MGYTADILIFGYSMQWYEVVGASIIVVCSVMVFVFKVKRYSD
jgi:drug/metabolite transporter (DMT)-like permease